MNAQEIKILYWPGPKITWIFAKNHHFYRQLAAVPVELHLEKVSHTYLFYIVDNVFVVQQATLRMPKKMASMFHITIDNISHFLSCLMFMEEAHHLLPCLLSRFPQRDYYTVLERLLFWHVRCRRAYSFCAAEEQLKTWSIHSLVWSWRELVRCFFWLGLSLSKALGSRMRMDGSKGQFLARPIKKFEWKIKVLFFYFTFLNKVGQKLALNPLILIHNNMELLGVYYCYNKIYHNRKKPICEKN